MVKRQILGLDRVGYGILTSHIQVSSDFKFLWKEKIKFLGYLFSWAHRNLKMNHSAGKMVPACRY